MNHQSANQQPNLDVARRKELYRRIRVAQGGGQPLDPALQRTLERSLGADLSALRLHSDTEAAAITDLLGVPAATAGNHIFFAASAYRPGTRFGLRLLAHEAAHAVQQAQRILPADQRLIIGAADSDAEREAERAATMVLMGRAPTRRNLAAPTVSNSECVFVQCFDSWEHLLLGEADTNSLFLIASQGPGWNYLVGQWRSLLGLWRYTTEVSEQQIHAIFPDLALVWLPGSQCLASYGELNAMGDYVMDADALYNLPASVIVPMLQQIRQQTYNRLGALLGDSNLYNFVGAIAADGGSSEIGELEELDAIDDFTIAQNLGINHFKGILARNADHFAPFAWHRWLAYHRTARQMALNAYRTRDPHQKAVYTVRAWLNQSYADHFLEDSFAAGHQVNKTRVMQWFVDWVSGSWIIYVPNWDSVSQVTYANQPNLWGSPLYIRGYNGPSNDPQTAEQHPTYQSRRNATGVQGFGSTSQDQAYQQYFDFLDAAVVQLGSNQVHNYLNNNSLWVASRSDATPLQLWGDDTMLNGVESTVAASKVVQISQAVINSTLAIGQSSTNVQTILDMMPSQVIINPPDPSSAISLQDWHEIYLQNICNDIFDGTADWLADILTWFDSTLGWISVDQQSVADPAPIVLPSKDEGEVVVEEVIIAEA